MKHEAILFPCLHFCRRRIFFLIFGTGAKAIIAKHLFSTKCSVKAALGPFSYKQQFISVYYTSASVIVPISSKYLGLLRFEKRFCRGWAWSKCSGFYAFARLINFFCNRAVEFDPKAQEYGHVNGKQLCRV